MDHAILSASGSCRWINCPPSARLEQKYETSTSSYAEEGTLAHRMAELKLRKKLICDIGEARFNAEMKNVYSHCLYKPEMEECTDKYIQAIDDCIPWDAPGANWLIVAEQKLSFDKYVPESFGTVDCMLMTEAELHIFDYKHGQGEFVSVEKNTQLMMYAIGALEEYAIFFQPEKIYMHVVQPRKNNIAVYETTADELYDWAETELKPAAAKAWEGEGAFNAGDHCNFCRVRDCKERSKKHLDKAKQVFRRELNSMTDDELALAIAEAAQFNKWYTSLDAYIKEEALKGRKFKNIRVVPSVKRSDINNSNRKVFVDMLKKRGFSEDTLYTKKDLTIAELRALVKSDPELKETLEKLISKEPKGYKIVTNTDLRDIFEP